MKNRLVKEGICKLTLKEGKFVDSHILPKALTRAEGLTPYLLQHGEGRTERRHSSWYDPHLVTEEGEKILAGYDDEGIRILRKHLLLWSGWGPLQRAPNVAPIFGPDHGFRVVEFESLEEAKRLRLFLLSVLWRGAATSRREFSPITMSQAQLERLRLMVLNGDPEPLGFYPVTLSQLSTLGERHNHAGIDITKTIPAIGDLQERKQRIFRFYIDGLILHFSRESIAKNNEYELDNFYVGNSNECIVTAVPFEDSAQAENLRITQIESALGRPLFEIARGPFSPD